ncbi:MAG: hypothetical protein AAF514_00090 [Verrucomicrobiota bacterium]
MSQEDLAKNALEAWLASQSRPDVIERTEWRPAEFPRTLGGFVVVVDEEGSYGRWKRFLPLITWTINRHQEVEGVQLFEVSVAEEQMGEAVGYFGLVNGGSGYRLVEAGFV